MGCVAAVPRSSAARAGFDPTLAADRRTFMTDLIFVALTFGFFAVSVAYAYACGRL